MNETEKPVVPTGMELMVYDSPSLCDAFRRELTAVLNKYSLENGSNTPDYMLADYLIECLRALDTTLRARARWYGRMDVPGRGSVQYGDSEGR